jgi:selenocysteine lyase/cysteine desulfurase
MGLMCALDYLAAQGMEAISHRERALARKLWEGLGELKKVKLYGAAHWERRVGVVLANIEGMIPADVGAILDADFGIATRVGLQCAPLVHQRLGTGRAGGVRFSLGPFNTTDQIDKAVEATKKIAQYRRTR